MASEASAHYTSGDLLARIEERLRHDGVDPARPTFKALTPYDHLHGRGVDRRSLSLHSADYMGGDGSGRTPEFSPYRGEATAEAGRSPFERVDAAHEEHVQVDVEVQRGGEAADEGDGSGAGNRTA